MLSSSSLKLAIITSEFNRPITDRLYHSAIEQCQALDIVLDEQDITWVPGAVEIPLIAQQYARKGSYDAIICLGSVIRGETSHYDYVCQQVSEGCQKVSLAHNIPVIFGVLTTEDEAQALARSGGAHSDKGRESVVAAVEMATLMQRF